ncbi:hypothetical protein P4S72_00695 [Vibrio sp. PP-XX7]
MVSDKRRADCTERTSKSQPIIRLKFVSLWILNPVPVPTRLSACPHTVLAHTVLPTVFRTYPLRICLSRD